MHNFFFINIRQTELTLLSVNQRVFRKFQTNICSNKDELHRRSTFLCCLLAASMVRRVTKQQVTTTDFTMNYRNSFAQLICY